MKKITKLMTVALLVTLNTSGILPIVNPTIEAHASSYTDGGTTQAGYITLGTYYLSKADVKDMAQNMRNLTGAGGIITGSVFSSLFKSYSLPLGVAISLAANAQSKTEVLKAADNNMRVKVVIKDQPVHTSYSTVTEFTAVN